MRLAYRLKEARYAIHPGIWYGLCNLWAYLPLVWRDRDWDWTYMVALWEKKFERMAAHESRYGHHTTSARDARDLRVCAALCKRIRSGEYDDKALEAHYAKWGYPSFEREDASGLLTMKPSGVKQGKEFMRIVDGSEAQIRADIAYLCSIVRKRLRGWWD